MFTVLSIHTISSHKINKDSMNAMVTSFTATGGSTTNSNKEPASSTPFLADLHAVEASDVWEALIIEAEALSKDTTIHVMEVGMHTAKQCLQIAAKNLQAHCVEPSPGSYPRIHDGITAAPKDRQDNIRFYQMAASATSGLDLEFSSEGGAGDHVGGGVDHWKMTKEKSDERRHVVVRNEYMTTVKSVAIDDIIYNKVGPTEDFASAGRAADDKIDKLFLLKVDTQGHEPSVFAGLKEAIQEHKIDFIMTEYWPKGIDLMNDSMGPAQECTKPVAMMKLLRDAGYTLYTMTITAHAKAPRKGGAQQKTRAHNRGRLQTPIDDLMKHCMWFYGLEREFPDTNTEDPYRMGYWTDVLAVAPGARLPSEPISKTGKLLARVMSL